MITKAKITTVTDYIKAAPRTVQPQLRQLRKIIATAAPKAEEKISYGMPYYHYHGRLAYFAYFKDHVSLFAMPPLPASYKKQLTVTGKSTIRFEIGEKLPTTVISGLIRTAVRRNKNR